MGKIVISENVSLDGVTQDPVGDDGFSRGGWVGRVGDRGREEAAKVLLDESLIAEAQLLGRRSYEFLAARWPFRRGELADRLNSMPKYVVSSTLEDPKWNNTTVLKGDPVTEVSKLKHALRGEIVVAASFQLVGNPDRTQPRRRNTADGLPGRARRRGALVRRDQRQKANAPRQDRDRRRPRPPHIRASRAMNVSQGQAPHTAWQLDDWRQCIELRQ